METSSKQPEISSMTHEEEEEMQPDISKLRDQVQQNSLPQKVTKAKMNGMDDKMEELKINLNKLLQEMVTNGESVVKETHDENKRNVNHDFIDSNVGFKTRHLPKINMRKFDGKDPITWMLQME